MYNCIITSVYLIGELIIGFGALLAKHFCTADTLVAEILLANRNMSIEARRRRIAKDKNGTRSKTVLRLRRTITDEWIKKLQRTGHVTGLRRRVMNTLHRYTELMFYYNIANTWGTT